MSEYVEKIVSELNTRLLVYEMALDEVDDTSATIANAVITELTYIKIWILSTASSATIEVPRSTIIVRNAGFYKKRKSLQKDDIVPKAPVHIPFTPKPPVLDLLDTQIEVDATIEEMLSLEPIHLTGMVSFTQSEPAPIYSTSSEHVPASVVAPGPTPIKLEELQEVVEEEAEFSDKELRRAFAHKYPVLEDDSRPLDSSTRVRLSKELRKLIDSKEEDEARVVNVEEVDSDYVPSHDDDPYADLRDIIIGG